MNRSTHFLEGSPGFNFQTLKNKETNKFEVTCSSHPELKWEGDSEIDAIRTATSDMQQKVMRGEV
jgi:hypothetical protein